MVHMDQGPKIMAALRNTAVSLLRHAGFSTIVARMGYNSIHPEAALQDISLFLENESAFPCFAASESALVAVVGGWGPIGSIV